MKKIRLIPIISFVLGIICVISFRIIGSEIAPDGTLVEPFALIPISYLFFFIGIISIIVLGFKFLFNKK